MTDIGIRELARSVSATLKRVKAGETLYLTERGERFAVIKPITDTIEEALLNKTSASISTPAEPGAFGLYDDPLDDRTDSVAAAKLLAAQRARQKAIDVLLGKVNKKART